MINKREGRGEGEENSPTSRWERYVKRNAGGGEGEDHEPCHMGNRCPCKVGNDRCTSGRGRRRHAQGKAHGVMQEKWDYLGITYKHVLRT